MFSGNYEKAYSYFSKIDYTIEGKLGLAYYYRKINDLDKAEDILSDISKSNESGYYRYYTLSMLGVLYNAKRDYNRSLSYLLEAKKNLRGDITPFTPRLNYQLMGWVEFSLGDYNRSVEAFDNASKINRLAPDVNYGLVFAYLAQLDYHNAQNYIKIYNLVIPEKSPLLDLKEAHTLVAERLYREYHLKDSIKVALSGLNGSYDNYQLLDILGLDYLEQNRTIDAFDMFNKSNILNDSDYLNHHGLGRVYYRLKESDKSEENFKRSIELAPDKAITYEGLGNLYFFQGEYDKAKDVFEAGIAKTDEMDDCQLFRRMAQISDIMNDTEDSAYYHAKAKRYENLCIVEAD